MPMHSGAAHWAEFSETSGVEALSYVAVVLGVIALFLWITRPRPRD